MYEDEYYFIRKPKNRRDLPFLTPDPSTANRNYEFEAQTIGTPPLKFHNGWKDENRAKGIRTTAPDVLFCGNNLVVQDKVREKLLDLELPAVHIFPSIYIDDQDRWHEDRWFLTFTEVLDCWDREASDYERDGPTIQLGGEEYFLVYEFALNKDILDSTPLEKRLLFKMGGVLSAYITAHQSVLAKIFGEQGKNGAEYIRVSDYGK